MGKVYYVWNPDSIEDKMSSEYGWQLMGYGMPNSSDYQNNSFTFHISGNSLKSIAITLKRK